MSMKTASAASVCSVTILPKLEIQVYNKQISRKKFIGCSCWGENTSLTRQIQQVLRHHLLDVKFYFRHRQQTEWRRIRDILYNRNGYHTGEHGRVLTAALISYIYNSRRARSGRQLQGRSFEVYLNSNRKRRTNCNQPDVTGVIPYSSGRSRFPFPRFPALPLIL